MAQLQTDVLDSTETIPAPQGRQETDSDVSILELLTILLQRKRLILAATLGAAILTAGVVFFLPPTFKAEATILPPQQQQSSFASLASGALGSIAGQSMATQLGLKNPADLYVGILGSRTIADDIISQFNLRQVYHAKLISTARKQLAGHVGFTAGKDSLIKIAVQDRDPNRAAAIANAYVDELHKLNSRLAISDASQRRLFFEQELKKEKDALTDAEIALKTTQQSTGLLAPTGQAEVLIRSGAQLRAEIASREVQLQAMRSYATDANPRVEVLQREISAMRSQLGQLEARGNGSSGSLEVSAGKLPEASLEYVRKMRDMKYHETLYELLAKQYEAARIDESKEAPLIQVVDRAVVPDRKSGPARLMLTAIAGILGLVASSAWAFIAYAIAKAATIPSHAAQLQLLNKALRA